MHHDDDNLNDGDDDDGDEHPHEKESLPVVDDSVDRYCHRIAR